MSCISHLSLTSNLYNHELIIGKAYKKLWIIKRLKRNGANFEDLLDIYTKQVRSHLEFAVPVWNSGLTVGEVKDIERVQKAFFHIVLGDEYTSYALALQTCGLETLESRRKNLCLKFASKTQKDSKHSHWFARKQKNYNTRSKEVWKPPVFKHERYRKSPIVYLTNLLNST